MQRFVAATHFSAEEVRTLSIHFDQIKASRQADGSIERSEFQAALGFTMKESLYVDRIIQLFDSNCDSYISFEEFVSSVSVLSSKGTMDEKLKCTWAIFPLCDACLKMLLMFVCAWLAVSFDVLDLDRDGKLAKDELLTMLEACIQENSIDIPKSFLTHIIDKTFEDVDTDKDGVISLDEYKALADSNPGMLSHITFNVSGIIAEYLPTLKPVASVRTKS